LEKKIDIIERNYIEKELELKNNLKRIS